MIGQRVWADISAIILTLLCAILCRSLLVAPLTCRASHEMAPDLSDLLWAPHGAAADDDDAVLLVTVSGLVGERPALNKSCKWTRVHLSYFV